MSLPASCRVAAISLLALAGGVAPAFATDMFGPDYKPCGDKDTMAEAADCAAAKTKAWDARLNAAYAALQQTVDPSQREPLRAAQRLWVQYRDANCGFYGAREGTIRQIQAAECIRAMTQDRAAELEEAAKP